MTVLSARVLRISGSGDFHDVDPLTFDGDRFGAPLALIYGMDVPVNKNEIGMFGGIHGLKQK